MDTLLEREEAVQDVEVGTLDVRVRQIRYEGKGINSYELTNPTGKLLPPFDAGSHIDVHLKNGVIRQYSLCNSSAERHRYVIAVLKDENGRGGSRAVHESLAAGDIVSISKPRNHFALSTDATRVVLIAGGIGVTPLKAMAHELDVQGVDFEMHYCARNREAAAFGDEFAEMQRTGKLHYHFDNGEAGSGLDIRALLRDTKPGTHVYYCGPAGFMAACADAASHWPKGTVHFEHFKAPEQPKREPSGTDSADGCNVTIASTGQVVHVSPYQNLAEVLNEAGVEVPTSCCAGLCATCKVRYLEGEVEHNDFILNEDERADYLTVCVSRPVGKTLVLDL
ncbi:ferredoxin-NADPH reductase [Caballeronia arationis]|uniref:Vanillate O-demethylase ferredoxin subunit n=1 Tax=Caballeronia arationis TaxID=1777142 RepID=A0A7Z7I5P0_9BURK|nr:PDR/VanB family oxidoreductase [Caballeronia arationis]SAL05241.1 ferredoxin-NADPH reductase [Caballeronia arationis]SOE62706.1 vanillate O-demethylase ferredoxin subunit [Caballeronia arationis]